MIEIMTDKEVEPDKLKEKFPYCSGGFHSLLLCFFLTLPLSVCVCVYFSFPVFPNSHKKVSSSLKTFTSPMYQIVIYRTESKLYVRVSFITTAIFFHSYCHSNMDTDNNIYTKCFPRHYLA